MIMFRACCVCRDGSVYRTTATTEEDCRAFITSWLQLYGSDVCWLESADNPNLLIDGGEVMRRTT